MILKNDTREKSTAKVRLPYKTVKNIDNLDTMPAKKVYNSKHPDYDGGEIINEVGSKMFAEEYLALVRECRDEEKMFQFLKEDKPGVALELAKSKNVTPRILDILTRHVSITVRHEVAKNPLTSISTLKILSADKDMLVRDYAQRTLRSVLS